MEVPLCRDRRVNRQHSVAGVPPLQHWRLSLPGSWVTDSATGAPVSSCRSPAARGRTALHKQWNALKTCRSKDISNLTQAIQIDWPTSINDESEGKSTEEIWEDLLYYWQWFYFSLKCLWGILGKAQGSLWWGSPCQETKIAHSVPDNNNTPDIIGWWAQIAQASTTCCCGSEINFAVKPLKLVIQTIC